MPQFYLDPNRDWGDDITLFGETNYRDRKRRFGIRTEDRRRHMYIIGKTGMGKSTMLENMIIQDIQKGYGVAFLDPHGQSAKTILRNIPSYRMNDVIYFNPADIDFPISFNIVEYVDVRRRSVVADGLTNVFKKIWADSWGPRLEYILRNCILALLEFPGSTLLGITRMLVDDEYRKKIVDKVEDPVVKSFWVMEYNKYQEKFRNEAIAPIQNKVGQFLANSVIRNIVGQPKSTINMDDIINSNKIFIADLSKGALGEDSSYLIGAMLVTKIQLAAMAREKIAEHDRKDFILYVDEFQNFATESFAGILSEARKYKLSLVVAHQYVTQLLEPVRDAVFGNVGTIVNFRIGSLDSELFAKEYEPYVLEPDLVSLEFAEIYTKLMIRGIASSPFSARTLPPIRFEEDNLDKIVRLTRERYASPVAEVADKINRWSGFDKGLSAEATAESFRTAGGGGKGGKGKGKREEAIRTWTPQQNASRVQPKASAKPAVVASVPAPRPTTPTSVLPAAVSPSAAPSATTAPAKAEGKVTETPTPVSTLEDTITKDLAQMFAEKVVRGKLDAPERKTEMRKPYQNRPQGNGRRDGRNDRGLRSNGGNDRRQSRPNRPGGFQRASLPRRDQNQRSGMQNQPKASSYKRNDAAVPNIQKFKLKKSGTVPNR